MKNIKKTILCLTTIFIILSSELFAQNQCTYPSENQMFSFCIEQRGQIIPIENNRVELDKSSFTLIMLMQKPMGVLVNFSLSDAIYKGFLKKKSLAEIIAQPDLFMGIGEGMGNPDEFILIDKLAPHYLFYTDGATHRFNNVELRDEHIIGRRVISSYTTYSEEFKYIPIEELEADRLYASFMFGDWDENYNRIELQKEALQIIFRE